MKDVAIATAKDKGKVAKAVEKRAQVSKKARILGEQRLTEIDVKLGGIELKLTEAESLNLAQTDVIADLKVAFETCEDKWYNEGFADAENSVEPIVYQAWMHWFGEGWMAVLQAMGVPDDFPLRNPEQIPFPKPPPPVQNPSDADNEEDTPSMRELVYAIDSYVELVDLEVTSNLNVALHGA